MTRLAVLLCLCQPPTPDGATPSPGTRHRVIPGPANGGGGLVRFVWGDTWRELWTTPISARVADLDSLRGGLTAFEEGMGRQTRSLRFRSTDGRIYVFRSVDKFPMNQAPGAMRWGPHFWVFRQQVTGILPAGSLLVGELEKAAGLTPTERWLAILPRSARLGEWGGYAGMLGLFERRYSPEETAPPEIPGAVEIVSTKTLFERLEEDSLSRVDQSAYLLARLLDLVAGDWERHSEQWSWAGVDRGGVRWWVAVPRDRDWALSHLDGFGNWLYNRSRNHGGPFEPRYGKLGFLIDKADPLDRRLLTGQDRSAFQAAAATLRARLSDRVLTRAVEQLPPEFGPDLRSRLVEILKQRRDSLPVLAERFAARLARVVDLRGTSGAEVVTITRNDDGSVLVEMIRAGGDTLLRRRFDPAETREIRVDPLGGADTVRVSGTRAAIPIRIVRGSEDLVLAGNPGRSLRIYEANAFDPPVKPTDPTRRFRDDGRSWGLAPWLNARSELGIVLGAGPVHTSYGFRRAPYHYRVGFRLGTTSSEGGFNADFKADYRLSRPHSGVIVRAAPQNRDMIHYFGLGNETDPPEDRSFNHVVQREYSLQPVLELGLNRSGTARLEVGGLVMPRPTETPRCGSTWETSVSRSGATGGSMG